MKNFNLDKNKAFFLFVDMQEKILKSINNGENVIKNTIIMAKTREILSMPALVTAQYPKGLGSNLADITKHLGEFKEYPKLSFDAYSDNDIKKAVDGIGKKQIIICGIETHICIYQTIRSLIEAGFEVFLPADACGSRNEFNHKNALNNLDQMGTVITNTETVLFDLAGVAGTDEFKTLQKLIK